MTRDEAWTLLNEYTKSDSLIKHALAVEAAWLRPSLEGRNPLRDEGRLSPCGMRSGSPPGRVAAQGASGIETEWENGTSGPRSRTRGIRQKGWPAHIGRYAMRLRA
jgi:hypothetical protein